MPRHALPTLALLAAGTLMTACAADPYTGAPVAGPGTNTAVGAGVGAVGGAVLGSAIAGRGNRAGGAIAGGLIGGLAGAAVGNANEPRAPVYPGYGYAPAPSGYAPEYVPAYAPAYAPAPGYYAPGSYPARPYGY